MISNVLSYKLVEINKPWFDARDYCKSQYHTQLLTIDSSELQIEIQNLTQKLNQPLWIGYNNIYDNNKWEWIDGSNCTVSTYWSLSDDEEGKNCAYVSSNGWVSAYCSKLNYFLCDDDNPLTITTEHPIHSNLFLSRWATVTYAGIGILMCCICGYVLAKICKPPNSRPVSKGSKRNFNEDNRPKKMNTYNGYDTQEPAQLLPVPSHSNATAFGTNNGESHKNEKNIDIDVAMSDKPKINLKPVPKMTKLSKLAPIRESREDSVERRSISSTNSNDRDNESMWDDKYRYKHERQSTNSSDFNGEPNLERRPVIIPMFPASDSEDEEKENEAMWDDRYRCKHQPTDSQDFNGEQFEQASIIIHGSEHSNTWAE